MRANQELGNLNRMACGRGARLGVWPGVQTPVAVVQEREAALRDLQFEWSCGLYVRSWVQTWHDLYHASLFYSLENW